MRAGVRPRSLLITALVGSASLVLAVICFRPAQGRAEAAGSQGNPGAAELQGQGGSQGASAQVGAGAAGSRGEPGAQPTGPGTQGASAQAGAGAAGSRGEPGAQPMGPGGQDASGQAALGRQAGAQSVVRGEYLARAGDCVACHTAPGGKEYVGGRAFKLSMGTLYSPNITPDRQTGIGAWSDDDFVKAMQEGVGPDGTHYYPAFPYNYFTRLSRADILAIKAYLFTLPPVRYRAPPNAMHFPFSQRWLMIFWNWIYNPNERFVAALDRSTQWNRGAYLVEGLGHCGACHTPMSILQGPRKSHALAGEVLQGWRAYNITSDKRFGIGAWRDEDLASYLSTGHANGHGSASGPMAEAINDSLRFLTREDVQSIVVYLKSTRPVSDGPVPATIGPGAEQPGQRVTGNAAPPENILAPSGTGARIFAAACVGCHSWDGSGRQSPYASFPGMRSFNDPDATNLVQVILQGTELHTANGHVFMPEFASGYSDAQLAALTNFITHRFGRAITLSAHDIRERRQP